MKEQKEWIAHIFSQAAPLYGEKGCTHFNYFGEQLAHKTSLRPGDHVLDVATGKGAVLFPVAQIIGPTGSLTGIDISQSMIDETKKKVAHPFIHLQQMDAEQLTFPDHSFDVLFCAFALFFFPNLPHALQQFKRVLKPHGRLSVSVWSQRSLNDAWVQERAKELAPMRALQPSPIESANHLRKVLSEAGFTAKIEELTYVSEMSREEWWDALWSHGTRSHLEQLPPDKLASLKNEAFSRFPKIIAQERKALFAIC